MNGACNGESTDAETTGTSSGKSDQVKKRGRKRKHTGQLSAVSTSFSEDLEYEVEELLDHRHSADRNEVEFRVKWVNYPHSENTWEPISNLRNCLDSILNYFENKFNRTSDHGSQAEVFRATYFTFTKQEIEEVCLKYIRKGGDCFPDIDVDSLEKEIDLLARLPKICRSKTLLDKLKSEYLGYKGLMERKSQLSNLAKWEREINEATTSSAKIRVMNWVDLERRPIDFKYINAYIQNLPDKVSEDPPAGCSCDTICSKTKCDCAIMYNKCMVYSNSILKAAKGTPIVECNIKCPCESDCENRVVQKGRKIDLCIFKTENNTGWGVRTLENITKGQFVEEYVGEVITVAEASQRRHDERGNTYFFDLDYNDTENYPYTVDATEYGNISHFMNHSCDPNLEVYAVYINCLEPNLPRLGMFAKRNIKMNEELTFDYMCKYVCPTKEERKKTKGNRIKCMCGTSKCRGWL